MATKVIDAETILKHAAPITHQHAHEFHPFGHLVKLPIALDEAVCKESVENLNQLVADVMTLRDCTRSITGRSRDRRSIRCTCCSTSITNS
jgi:hypothetical protein